MTRLGKVVIAALLALAAWAAAPAHAERRLAFVAGIDAYPNLPPAMQLERAVRDAETVADTLATLGFEVTRLTQGVTQEAFLRRFGEFVRAIEPGDTVLFYYAGHGISLDGTNYLIPSDAPALGPGDERLVRSRSLAETDLITDIRERGARVTVMVLDACRDNPFPRTGTRSLGATRGLATREPAEGVFSIYAAGFGQSALDRLPGPDPSPNSVFTRVFVAELKKPGVNLLDLGESVREEVAALAKRINHPQVPAVYNQILGARSVFLAGRPPVPAPAPAPAPAPLPARGEDEIAWAFLERSGSIAQIEEFLAGFPGSPLRPQAEARLAKLRSEAETERLAMAVPDPAAVGARPADPTPRMPPAFTFPFSHSSNVTDVAFAPDGRALATSSDDSSIRLWDPATGLEIRTLAGREAVRSLAFAPDGRMLAAGGDGRVTLWDVSRGQEIRRLDILSADAPVAFSPDGRTIAGGGFQGTLLWDAASGRAIRLLPDDRGVTALAFSPDGRMLASQNASGRITLWDAASGRSVRTLAGSASRKTSVAFSPDGRVVVAGSRADAEGRDDLIKLWDAATGQEIRTLSGHAFWVRSAAFSPDGRRLASGSVDGSIKLWDPATGREIGTLSGHKGEVNALAFSPDGRSLASVGADVTIKLWNVAASSP